jgi:nitrogen fixation protein FixH
MKQRELTGRTVLICLVAFFGVVAAANAVLIRAATSTFGGVEVASSYSAGLKFQREVDSVREQDALHWQVAAHLVRRPDGEAELDIAVRDRAGLPVTALAAAARLDHPADARHDHAIAMLPAGPGAFTGVTPAEPAQWDLVIELSRDGRTMFRSKSRVGLK